jgi:alpha-mannosidase
MIGAPSERTIHLICNAHLDPVWLWEWEEGAAAAISTFRTAADLCEQFDGFIFNHNEVILYRWVEEYDPALFARIQRLVKEGRWHIIGGWYLQPDCNMPSGESFVRQILLGRRYFAEKFGSRPTTAINFDSFGHSRGLVQILTRSGYNSYVFCRPDQPNCALPNGPFTWEGFDGSRVLAVRPWGHYLSALGKARQKIEDYMKAQPADNPGILLWGVGDHGGGPSRIDLQVLTEMIAEPSPARICHSTPEAYFAEAQAFTRQQNQALPLRSASLNAWGVGCYSTQSQVKHKHRALENELYLAEKMAASAWAQDRISYPQADLQEAMRDLATAEFHDILPGSSIQPVEEMALRLTGHGLELLSRVKARAFFALAQGQPTAKENEVPILVYNPHPYPVTAVVESEFQLADQNWGSDFTIANVYQNGQLVPCQIEQELSNLNLDWRKRIAFQAELAPSQMNRFDCHLERVPARPVPTQPEGDAVHFHNDQMEVTINKRTGLIDAYRVHGDNYLRPGAGRFLVLADSPDPWTFTKRRFDQVIGSFRLLSPHKSAWFAAVNAPTLAPVRVIEDGALRTVIEALFGYQNSYLCVRYKLPKQGAEIEIEARVHWNEKDRLLKLSLPSISRKSRLLGQVAYGVEELPADGDESVAQKWAAVVSGDTALTVVNDRTYGLDYSTKRAAAGELRLTLLRGAGYAAHPILERPLLPEDRYSPRQDQGERLFHFWLQGGPTAMRMANIDREALAHNEQPMALSFFPGGEGEKPIPLAIIRDPAVQVTAIKKAEDGSRLVIRLFEPTGQIRTTLLDLPFAGVSKEIHLSPFEIKTLCFDPSTKTWEETNLLEEKLV